MNTHLVLLLAYAALQIGLGLWIGRRVKSAGDFFVAGRSLSPGLLFATLVAANIGAGSTIGATGLGFRDGLAAWWWVGSAAIGSTVLALTVGPRIWRVAKENDLQTTGDFLAWRYGESVRGIVALLLWFGTIAILAGQLIAMGLIINVVAGVPKATACLIGGIVATLYFTAGGLLSSAWVNVVQVCVKLVGFSIALVVLFGRVGGLAGLHAATPSPEYWNFWSNGPSGLVYVALLAPAFVVSPGLIQKIYGARDERAVRIGVLGNAVVLFGFAIVPVFLGMIARALHPDLATPEQALPTLFTRDMTPLLGALGLAAVVSAELSTIDAVLLMLATSLSKDLYARFVNPEATSRQLLLVSRIAAVAGGVLGVVLAIVGESVISQLSIFYAVLSVSLFVPVVAGLYSRRFGTPEALAAIASGIAVLFAVRLASGGVGWGLFSPSLLGIAASAAVGGISFMLWRRAAVA